MRKELYTVLLMLVGAATLALPDALLSPLGQGGAGRWVIMGEDPIIIGGYGDNFAYNGNDVRRLKGYVTVDLDTATKQGRIGGVVWTTPESGPILFSRNHNFEGEIRWVQEFSGEGRTAEFIWLHGDSGVEEPVLPAIFNWLATWGPTEIYVNGELPVREGGHFMFTPNTRKENFSILQGRDVYSPARKEESGWFTPEQFASPIIHLVVHSNIPDRNNFPPHSNWMHINFQTLYVLQVPDGISPSLVPGSLS